MIEQPQFRTVLRGYDPEQVLAALTALSGSLAVARRTAADRTMELTEAQERAAVLNADLDEAVARLAAAERDDGSRSRAFGDLGTRVAAILNLADEEAAQVKAESARYATDVRSSVDAEVARMRSAAAQAADEIVQRATEQATAAVAQSEAEAAELTRREEGRLAEIRQQLEATRREVQAAHAQADAVARAKVTAAERSAAQILEEARRDAADVVREAHIDLEESRREHAGIHNGLGDIAQLLDRLDAELSALTPLTSDA